MFFQNKSGVSIRRSRLSFPNRALAVGLEFDRGFHRPTPNFIYDSRPVLIDALRNLPPPRLDPSI